MSALDDLESAKKLADAYIALDKLDRMEATEYLLAKENLRYAIYQAERVIVKKAVFDKFADEIPPTFI